MTCKKLFPHSNEWWKKYQSEGYENVYSNLLGALVKVRCKTSVLHVTNIVRTYRWV